MLGVYLLDVYGLQLFLQNNEQVVNLACLERLVLNLLDVFGLQWFLYNNKQLATGFIGEVGSLPIRYLWPTMVS